MAAATMGRTYSPPSSRMHSTPDTVSPVYPERLIRPLPKRRLRSRLPDDVADSILYPPAPPSTQPLFFYQYGENGDTLSDDKSHSGRRQSTPAVYTCNHGHDHDIPYDEDGFETDREDTYAHNRDGQQHGSSSPPPDGYDSFENTNNKKKRKIPTSGNIGGHHSSLSADLANMGISGTRTARSPEPDDGSEGVGQYYGSGSSASIRTSASGLSGPGRGRFGRRPLGTSLNASNAWSSTRSARRDWASNPLTPTKGNPANQNEQGIISAAIANAAALPVTPKGQENVSLLQQQLSKTVTPTSTQFTFTCESDKTVAWPIHSPTPGYYQQQQPPQQQQQPQQQQSQQQSPLQSAPPTQKGFATQGTQTSPNIATSQPTQQQPVQPAAGQVTQKKTRRRRPGKEYEMAERQRRLQQEYSNFHHPPKPEDVWICEYCEYESIFGTRPEALIRQYEIKDRKERKRLAEKRRLLEKAKMKGRKGKRSGKGASKQASAASAQSSAHHSVNAGIHSQGTQSEDYLGDEYDAQTQMQAPHQAPSRSAIPPMQRTTESRGMGAIQMKKMSKKAQAQAQAQAASGLPPMVQA